MTNAQHDTMRENFEHTYVPMAGCTFDRVHSTGEYSYQSVQSAWASWQSCAAQSAATIARLESKINLGECDECGTLYSHDPTDGGSICVKCQYDKIARLEEENIRLRAAVEFPLPDDALTKLGKRLTEILDDDIFNNIEPLLNSIKYEHMRRLDEAKEHTQSVEEQNFYLGNRLAAAQADVLRWKAAAETQYKEYRIAKYGDGEINYPVEGALNVLVTGQMMYLPTTDALDAHVAKVTAELANEKAVTDLAYDLLSDIVNRTCDALKGKPPEGTLYTTHDLPEVAAELQAKVDALVPPGWKVVPIVPTEQQWGGLSRDIVFWHDMTDRRTPRSLFAHLELHGREIPQWLRDEPELQNLDHAISKGTRAVIIYRAMLEAAPDNQKG